MLLIITEISNNNKCNDTQKVINPFLANIPILYPLKTSESQRFSGVFKRYKMGTLARIGLIIF